jgi:uncharacterized protein YdbL (DUF1318 family)
VNNRTTHLIIVLMSIVTLLSATASATTMADTREELQKRFEQRFSKIDKLKGAGEVGETWKGYVEAIDDRLLDADEKKLLAEENADRKKLYQVIADEVVEDRKKQLPADEVALENGKRNIEKARPKDYLWVKEGRWVQKRDESRYAKLVKLKKDGVVGETWEGYVEAVASGDGDAKALIAAENDARRAMYESLAKKLDTAAEKLAQQAAKEIEKNLQGGRQFKDKSGKWRKQPE